MLLKADMENDAEVRAMVAPAGKDLGRLEILIVNAAATACRPLLEVKPHNLTRTLNLSDGGFVVAVSDFMTEAGVS
jgi:enoyl-[acyl-carrier protein] reductase III